jgi:hypothetical protein
MVCMTYHKTTASHVWLTFVMARHLFLFTVCSYWQLLLSHVDIISCFRRIKPINIRPVLSLMLFSNKVKWLTSSSSSINSVCQYLYTFFIELVRYVLVNTITVVQFESKDTG